MLDTADVLAQSALGELDLESAAYAAPVHGPDGLGWAEHTLVAPASVMKIQIALAAERAIAHGTLDGQRRMLIQAKHRTPGPVGMSLMQDDVVISVRDLVITMLTISDNPATDELIGLVGLDAINELVRGLGLRQTRVTSDLRHALDAIAHDAGFPDYEALAAYEPTAHSALSQSQIQQRISRARALDPRLGTSTTAHEMVLLLQAIWSDRAATADACRKVRAAMANQLTKARIASGFDSSVKVAAKSGALLGVVRNEVGVVTYPDGDSYAIAVFTRRAPDSNIDPALVDRAIGETARALVDELRQPK